MVSYMLKIYPSQLSGSLVVPPSKSHTMRAILLASLARGRSKVEGILPSPDTEKMIALCRQFGASFEGDVIEGVAGAPQTPADVVDSGNSGQVLRFGGAIAALAEGYTVLTGDHSLRHQRPAEPLLSGLRQLGAFACSTRGNGQAPLIIQGRLKGGRASLCGRDSQPVSALLFATALLEGGTELEVHDPGETPWINVTLDWLKRLGREVEHRNYRHYWIRGLGPHASFNYLVPGDWSSAAYPIVAAVLTHSSLRINGLDPHDVQGDKQLVDVLRAMGAKIHWTETGVEVLPGGDLLGLEVDVNPMIDMITLVALLGCFAQGKTLIRGGAIARRKECDRIAKIAQELRKMGGSLEELEDGLIVRPAPLQGACLQAHNDHRIALTLAVAALAAQGASTIQGWETTKKSYPNFVRDFRAVGGQFFWACRSFID
ncbi:MAG: 3-phosphoshikimate 1-carboxyvinyltransferase [Verrucomicrobia bacterium]|nr:3-phosphoshikimate 1-carboxyvinyltransferase [Verrucomicrobiota bacterium]